MASTLEFLKKHTTIVADSGDFEAIKKYAPVDSTTNPSLILQASKMPQYSKIIDAAIEYAKQEKTIESKIETALIRTFVLFGCEILKIVPGRVSTEVDARFSFDVTKQVNLALRIIQMYEELGFSKDRILIKLSSTWEGIRAAQILESEHGIHCNLTLMFSLCQAIACAEAGVTLISPFVGRVLDWHASKFGPRKFDRMDDPGVRLVSQIYHYYKKYGYKTEIMGASFRNTDQILGLAGCDLLTIAPNLLEQLASMSEIPAISLSVEKVISADGDCKSKRPKSLEESDFRWQLNQDEMATDKLSDGIRRFAQDAVTLENLLKERLMH